MALKTAGIIFAGGKSRRLGGLDKGAISINGASCFERTRRVLEPHIDKIAISRQSASHSDYGTELEQISDWPSTSSRAGVAFAILGSLKWAQQQGYDTIITAPVDTPFLPVDFAARLLDRFETQIYTPCRPVCAHSDQTLHGLHALWPVSCADALAALIEADGINKIQTLHAELDSDLCDFELGDYDRFMNINTPKDLKAAEEIAAQYLS